MASNENQKLEVPSKETQTIRKEAIIQKLLHNEKPLDKSKPQASAILNQVKTFIPKIKTANEKLENLDKSTIQVDGEVGEGQPYVEMNVQLYEEDGTSDSDSDSTDSTLSPDSSEDDDEDLTPSKQQRLITEIDKVDTL